MPDFYYRTEDIRPDSILSYFVEISEDRSIVDSLKLRNPSILVGSRGTGKSFLLRVAEAELSRDFGVDRVLPVYTTFAMSALIQTTDQRQFTHWMIARLAANLVRVLRRRYSTLPEGIRSISGTDDHDGRSRIEMLAQSYEESWTHGTAATVNSGAIPTADDFKDAVEGICGALELERIAFFIDEAAHILLPEQQRQFFTLFRDLRSPYLTCCAAVYPGVTAYGDAFQRSHDATFLFLSRDVLAKEYINRMREVVEKQADSATLGAVARNSSNFTLLAYAASGNPRLLLKTLNRASSLGSHEVNSVIRKFYRIEFWNDHTTLSDKYSPYKAYIDWGRDFLEKDVLVKLRERNRIGREATSFFYIDKNAPQAVDQALDLLAYTGIIVEHEAGIRATRGSVGTRYLVNLGTIFATLGTPTVEGLVLVRALSPKRFAEYGSNYQRFVELQKTASDIVADADPSPVLREQLKRSIDVLDITEWQKTKLRELDLATLGDVLTATDEQLQEAYYVGQIRSRQMKNAAQAAVFEYLTG
jgi:hypothetical protein